MVPAKNPVVKKKSWSKAEQSYVVELKRANENSSKIRTLINKKFGNGRTTYAIDVRYYQFAIGGHLTDPTTICNRLGVNSTQLDKIIENAKKTLKEPYNECAIKVYKLDKETSPDAHVGRKPRVPKNSNIVTKHIDTHYFVTKSQNLSSIAEHNKKTLSIIRDLYGENSNIYTKCLDKTIFLLEHELDSIEIYCSNENGNVSKNSNSNEDNSSDLDDNNEEDLEEDNKEDNSDDEDSDKNVNDDSDEKSDKKSDEKSDKKSDKKNDKKGNNDNSKEDSEDSDDGNTAKKKSAKNNNKNDSQNNTNFKLKALPVPNKNLKSVTEQNHSPTSDKKLKPNNYKKNDIDSDPDVIAMNNRLKTVNKLIDDVKGTQRKN